MLRRRKLQNRNIEHVLLKPARLVIKIRIHIIRNSMVLNHAKGTAIYLTTIMAHTCKPFKLAYKTLP